MIGYKKVYAECKNQYGTTKKQLVLKLEIIGAVVKCSGVSKLRTSKAFVLKAYNVNYGNRKKNIPHSTGARLTKNQQRRHILRSIHDPSFVYRIGYTVSPNNGFNPNINEDCGSGIHFYLTKKEAANH